MQILLLVGLVELQKSRGILAIMEFACSLVADEAYVLPAIKKAIQ
jgi:hypothetical protein